MVLKEARAPTLIHDDNTSRRPETIGAFAGPCSHFRALYLRLLPGRFFESRSLDSLQRFASSITPKDETGQVFSYGKLDKVKQDMLVLWGDLEVISTLPGG